MTTHCSAFCWPSVEPSFGSEQDRIDLDRWEAESPMVGCRQSCSETELAERKEASSGVDKNFTDPRLQAQYEHCLAEVDPSSGGVRRVCALVALHDWVQLLEGAHSPRVHQTIDQLLLPHMRLELCRWLQRSSSAKAGPLRDQLLHLVGEAESGAPVESSSFPS